MQLTPKKNKVAVAFQSFYSLDLDSSLANALAAAPHTAPREKLRMAVLLSLSIVRTPGERAAKAIAISSAWLALRVRTLHDVTILPVVAATAAATAFHKWTEAERKRIDAAIRKAYAGAMGLLNGTKTTALLSLGAHNTLSEIGEAQRTAQLTRLGRTAVGRRLLERVGLSSPEEQDHETSPLTESTMRRLVVYPLPKNMGPGESEGRRAARARALLLQHQNDEGANSMTWSSAFHFQVLGTFILTSSPSSKMDHICFLSSVSRSASKAQLCHGVSSHVGSSGEGAKRIHPETGSRQSPLLLTQIRPGPQALLAERFLDVDRTPPQ
ncbi:hypothetical protein MRX96_040846 [Rhipicephalus microplus]